MLGLGGTDNGNANGSTDAAPATRVSLLDQYLAPIWGTNVSPDEAAQRANAENARREELIAQCMHEAGFEYTPNPAVITPTPETSADSIWRPDDRAWVEEFGYAAIVSPWTDLGRGEELGEAAVANIPQDPNQEFMNSLSETERQAYINALWGEPIEISMEEDANLTMEDRFAMMGCWGFAQGQLQTARPSDLVASDEFAPLFEAMSEMYNSVYQRPEWIEIDRDWANCMADRGHPGINNQNEAQQGIFDDLNAFWQQWDWEANPQAPTISTSPELAAIHQRELAMAITDFECREAVNYRQRQNDVMTTVEQQFINDHRATLDALVAAAEQLG